MNKRNLILIGIILLFISLIFINSSFSHTEISYKTISVSSGDTLWNIAKQEKSSNIYFENKDVRDIIDEIKSINNLTNSKLNIGQKLSVPTL